MRVLFNYPHRNGPEPYVLSFYCPGCKQEHPYHVANPHRGASETVWTWNGSMEAPTFSPSLLVYPSPGQPRCHCFVRDGRIEFCGDSDHALAGQTVPMVPWDESKNDWSLA